MATTDSTGEKPDPSYATALNSNLTPVTKTKLIYRSPEIHKGKSAVFFTIQEEEELAKDCKFTLIGKFSHGRPSIEDIRSDFSARFTVKGKVSIGHYNNKHIFMDFSLEEDYLNIYSRRKFMVLGFLMRLVTWTVDFNPEEETPLTPVWIHLPELKWHYYNWDALVRITSPLGTLLKIDKATEFKSRPNFAKVMVEIDLTKQRRNSVWVGIRNNEGIECGGFYQSIEYDFVPDYCFKCKHQGHYEDECLVSPKYNKHPHRDNLNEQDFQNGNTIQGQDAHPNATPKENPKIVDRPQDRVQYPFPLRENRPLANAQNVVSKPYKLQNVENPKMNDTAGPSRFIPAPKKAKSKPRLNIRNGIRDKLAKRKNMQWRTKSFNLNIQVENQDPPKQLLDSNSVVSVDSGSQNIKEDNVIEPVKNSISVPHASSIPVRNSFQHLLQLQEVIQSAPKQNIIQHSQEIPMFQFPPRHMDPKYRPESFVSNVPSSPTLPHSPNDSQVTPVSQYRPLASASIEHDLTISEFPNAPTPNNAIMENEGVLVSDSKAAELVKSQPGINLAVHSWSREAMLNKSAPAAIDLSEGISYANMAPLKTRQPNDTLLDIEEYSSEGEDEIVEKEEDEYEECNSTDEEELIKDFAPSTSWVANETEDAITQFRNDIIMKGNLSPRSNSIGTGKKNYFLVHLQGPK